jgi:hypothetical protein
MPNKSSYVDEWIKERSNHQVKALEKASKVFDDKDSLTVNSLEAVYGRETSFGKSEFLGKRGSTKPAGHFQQKKDAAIEQKLKVTENNDERFDIDPSSISAAGQLKDLDNIFRRGSNLGGKRFAIPIKDIDERRKFDFGAYNLGQGRVVHAQELAKQAVKDPTKWSDVEKFLEATSASPDQVQEAMQYVEDVLKHEKIFKEKSKADKKLKDKDLVKGANLSEEGHWVTLDDGRHVLIGNKA